MVAGIADGRGDPVVLWRQINRSSELRLSAMATMVDDEMLGDGLGDGKTVRDFCFALSWTLAGLLRPFPSAATARSARPASPLRLSCRAVDVRGETFWRSYAPGATVSDPFGWAALAQRRPLPGFDARPVALRSQMNVAGRRPRPRAQPLRGSAAPRCRRAASAADRCDGVRGSICR